MSDHKLSEEHGEYYSSFPDVGIARQSVEYIHTRQASTLKEKLMTLSESDDTDNEKTIISPHITILRYGEPIAPKMYTKDFLGIYAHYCAVGFQGGIQGLILNFCVYSFLGDSNVCANATSIIFMPWSFKIFYAMVIDSYRPFGLRRKPYMIFGWSGVLLFTLILACTAHVINDSTWIMLSMMTMFFLMIADVPADGYCVELGKLEVPEERGQVLATGQRLRFTCTILAGFIQAFMVNGPTTNPVGCPIRVFECWDWGLTVSQYYGFLFVILAICFIPIIFLKELDAKHIPLRTFSHHVHDLWDTLCNRTTLFLLIFVTGNGMLSTMTNIVTVYLQYYVIGLTNFQSGIDTVTTYLALVFAIWLFQTFFINRNWRITQYLSSLFNAILGITWLLPFYDVYGLLNGWFTIFINVGQGFALGISQVLFAMAVIELAKPGQEAITYELIISVANSASTLSTIVATQMTPITDSVACSIDDDYSYQVQHCPANEVQTDGNIPAYQASHGPDRFANYTYMILAVNIVCTLFFTRYLPRQKEQCHQWRKEGDEAGNSFIVGYASVFIAAALVLYGVVAVVVLLNPATACMPAFGGSGC